MNRPILDANKKFSDHGGILRTNQALVLVSRPGRFILCGMQGLIRQLDRGVYQLATEEPLRES